MATIKMACPKCAQRVSGDETFYGKTVICPVCDTEIVFPKEGEELPPLPERPVHDEEAAKRLAEYEKNLEDARKQGKKLPGTDSEPKSSEPPRELKPKPKEEAPAPEKRKPAAAPAPARRSPAAPAVAGAAAAAAGATTPGTKEPPPNSGAALWSMILGIAAYALCPIGPFLAFPAIVLGHSGRGSIQRSLGKIGGMGMANAGLALGYSYMIILALFILAGPWKTVGSHWAQTRNAQSATTLVTALGKYAGDNGEKFPASIEDLVPDYLEQSKLDAAVWIDPGTFPMMEPHKYTYHPGHKAGDDPKTILLSSPKPDGLDRRLVAYLDGSVELLPDNDFLDQTGQ